MGPVSEAVRQALNQAVKTPCLRTSRLLEQELNTQGYPKHVFGRVNQKASIEAASESDRGITERLANAFDASLTAARLAMGIQQSDRTLTPRKCTQRFLCPSTDLAEWEPQDKRIKFGKPSIQFWAEEKEEKLRFRKYHPGDGLVSALVRDSGIGMSRQDMPKTILDLNSESKLRAFEAIGQFGHGGSSSLAFCESCLIITKPRFSANDQEFYWTLIFTEEEEGETKQSLIRKWFAEQDGMPLVGVIKDFQDFGSFLPGTSIWHFGYNRGGWITRIAGSGQENPWGRLGRLLFSYPLPFEIQGEFARTDTPTGHRTIKGAFYRLLDKKGDDAGVVEYASSEKSEKLIVEGESYGQFSVFVFVLRDRKGVRNYADIPHPIILTLNGQNHGEMTRTILVNANLPELASSSIVEVRLDGLEEEALREIISNSRETPKITPFTRVLKERLQELLGSDEALLDIEKKRQEEKAKKSNKDLNNRIERFLSEILSDAAGPADTAPGGDAPGTPGRRGDPRPEIPPNDPPRLLEFLDNRGFFISEGGTQLAKFKSDARPPKYSFHGDNPRCFALLKLSGPLQSRLSIVGKADINSRGYGHISLNCIEDPSQPIKDKMQLGELFVRIQCADGTTLESHAIVGVKPKSPVKERRRRQEVKTQINFGAPENEDLEELSELLAEENLLPFTQCTYLEKYREALGILQSETTYWGEKTDRDGISTLQVEINAGNPQFKKLLQSCRTSEERMVAKERYLRDVVLDCYQHCFKMDGLPDAVIEHALTEPEDGKRAAEIHLNNDKALRTALHELESSRDKVAQ